MAAVKAKPKKKASNTYKAGDQSNKSIQLLNKMVTGSSSGIRRSDVDGVTGASPKPKKKPKK